MKKSLRYVLALAIIFTLNFFIPRIMPGDPVTNLTGEDVALSAENLTALKAELGLDRPLAVQYLRYWADILRLDLGYSIHANAPVSRLIGARLPWTLALIGISIFIGAVLGTTLGALSGWGKSSLRSRSAAAVFLAVYSTPPFFLSLMLLFLFAFKLPWFPLRGFLETGTLTDLIHHFFLPVFSFSLFLTARNFLVMRGSVLQEKGKPYVLFARAKGLPDKAVLFRHVFKNASLPVITLIVLDFGFILSGALFIEIVFSLNGMGTLIYEALLSRDYPVLQGVFLIITVMVILANAAADWIYGRIDPRVRRNP